MFEPELELALVHVSGVVAWAAVQPVWRVVVRERVEGVVAGPAELMVGAAATPETDLIYLNAANVCPASRPVMDRHLEFLRDFHANPSFQHREKYKPMYESLRAKLGRLLNAQPDEIAYSAGPAFNRATDMVYKVEANAGQAAGEYTQ